MRHTNETLVGLRGFLALSVVIYHIYVSAVLEKYIIEIPKEHLLYLINYAGPISVNLFFVISGYLITKSLINKRTIGEFFLDRILRIYPVFLTIHLIIFAAGPIIEYKWMSGITLSQYILHFFSNLFLLPGMFPLPIAQIVAWSLSYEFVFYLISGIIFYVYSKSFINNYLKYTFYFFMTLVCTAIIYMHPNTLFFIVGVVAFFCETTIRNLYKPGTIFYFNGAIFLALIYLSYTWENINIFVPLSLSFLFFPSIITEHGFMSKLLRSSSFLYLGKISYSLYMWHTMIMFPLKKIIPKIGLYLQNSSSAFIIYFVLCIVLSIIVSHLSYQYIEIKLANYCKELWNRQKERTKDILISQQR